MAKINHIDVINKNGYVLIGNLLEKRLINDVLNNILSFANIFRKKIVSKDSIPSKMIKNVDDLSQFLIWLDKYNNQYLFSFVSLVSSLYKIKQLCYKDIFIKKASELLLIPDEELLCGEISFLVNTPESKRLIYHWHNAKNYYPKREKHINFWVPIIIDKTKNNGTLEIAKGSHLNDYPFLEFQGPTDKSKKGNLTQNLIPDCYVKDFDIEKLECKVGSFAAILPKTIHSGSLNQSLECSYVLVFKIWANHKDWTLSSNLSQKYFEGDIGSGPDITII